MKITNQAILGFIYSSNLSRENYNNFSRCNLERVPMQDCISFSSRNKTHKTREKVLPENVQAAVKFSDKIYELAKDGHINLETVADLIHSYDSEIDVKSKEDLAKLIPDSQNYTAFFRGTMADDFSSTDKQMFLDIPQKNSEEDIISFAMNSAHEFTHAHPSQNERTFEFLKRVSRGNSYDAKVFMTIGEQLFKYFDTEVQAMASLGVFNNPLDISSLVEHRMVLPRAEEVSKGDILKSLHVKDEKEFKSQVLNKFNSDFDNFIAYASKDKNFYETMPYKNNLNKLASIVKSYCAYKALDEYEAYTTESVVGKKLCNIEGSANIDVLPMYYQMLGKAFS